MLVIINPNNMADKNIRIAIRNIRTWGGKFDSNSLMIPPDNSYERTIMPFL